MRSNAGKLLVVCDDYDMGSGNDYIGQVNIDMANLADRKELRAWYPLADKEDKVGADIGHVLISLRWVFNPERLSPVDQPLDWNNPKFDCEDVLDDGQGTPELPNELNIYLIKAYGLQIMDKNMFSKGGSSDPVVSFKIGDEVVKSTVKKKTLAPEWNEKFSLPVKSEEATLEVIVDDYDMASGNDLMGSFKILLADAKDRQEHRAWYPLAGEDGVVGADIGHVLLAFKWIHNPNRLSPMDLPPDYSNPPFPDLGFLDDYNKAPNEVQLFLIKGWGLKVMDKNMFSKGGSSDPMVTFFMGDEKQKSKVVKKNLNPEWNANFTFPVKSDQAVIKAICDDYDMASGNDEMGR
jgi:Ca2+-dependent lipid-binding protein